MWCMLPWGPQGPLCANNSMSLFQVHEAFYSTLAKRAGGNFSIDWEFNTTNVFVGAAISVSVSTQSPLKRGMHHLMGCKGKSGDNGHANGIWDILYKWLTSFIVDVGPNLTNCRRKGDSQIPAPKWVSYSTDKSILTSYSIFRPILQIIPNGLHDPAIPRIWSPRMSWLYIEPLIFLFRIVDLSLVTSLIYVL